MQEVWKGVQNGEEGNDTDVETVTGSSKKRRKQPDSLHESSSDGEYECKASVDADAAFEILSLLSALHEPAAVEQRPRSKEPRELEVSLDRSHAHSAEWLLLDVIDSLEQPGSSTPAASTACSADDRQHPSYRFQGMVPSPTSQRCTETAAVARGPDESGPGGSKHPHACQLARSDSCRGGDDSCQDDLDAEHTVRDLGCPMLASGNGSASAAHGSPARDTVASGAHTP